MTEQELLKEMYKHRFKPKEAQLHATDQTIQSITQLWHAFKKAGVQQYSLASLLNIDEEQDKHVITTRSA